MKKNSAKILLISFLTICLVPTTKADIVIVYKVTVEHENPLVDRSSALPETIALSFNSKYARLQYVGLPATRNQFDLFPLGKNFHYAGFQMMGAKQAIKRDNSSADITYSPDSLSYNIIGIQCRKAFAKKRVEK